MRHEASPLAPMPQQRAQQQRRRLARVLSALSPSAAASAADVPQQDETLGPPALSAPFLPVPADYDWRVDPPAHTVAHRVLTPDEKQRWQRDGYVKLDKFLDSAQLERWRTCVDHAVAERRGARFPADPPQDAEEESNKTFYATVFEQTLNLHQTSPSMRQIVFDGEKTAASFQRSSNVFVLSLSWQSIVLYGSAHKQPSSLPQRRRWSDGWRVS
jgi:hypothetical protein